MSSQKLKSNEIKRVIREPAEVRFKDQINALKSIDTYDKPEGWQLSPKMVYKFIIGMDEPIKLKTDNNEKEVYITKKFYGDDIMIQRAISSLASDRPLLLIGEPGTAKSWLSENLAAAICNNSLNIIQGTAGTTEDQIKYSWNYATLLSKGPCLEALVPAPFYKCMKEGMIVRFEEITRCTQEIQDIIISILSEKVLTIPEIPAPNDIIFAKKGFGVIGTANTRDRGVNEMSAALKRRFNFETVSPIKEIKEEIDLVQKETESFLERSGIKIQVSREIIELIVTTFNEMRNGVSAEGIQVARPSVAMSTAEAVEVSINTAIYSHYINNDKITPDAAVINLLGSVVKDNYDDYEKLVSYFNIIVKKKADLLKKHWKEYYESKRFL